METSIFLAKVLGIFFVVSTTAILVRYEKSMELEKDAVSNPGLATFAGYMILILGILMVVSHQVWVLDWRVLITILGWMVLLKGAGRIFFPEAVKGMIEKKQTDRRFILGEVAVLIIGLYLLYQGFIAH